MENNRNLTVEGLGRLRYVRQLRTLKLRTCMHVGVAESKQLLAEIPKLERVNDFAAAPN